MSLTDAEASLLAEDCWDFIQMMALRGHRYLVLNVDEARVHIGKSALHDAPQALRLCADLIEAEYNAPAGATKN